MQALEALPASHVRLGTGPLAPDCAATLTSIRVAQGLGAPTLCELSFVEPPAEFVERATSSIGNAVEIRLDSHDTVLFVGEVTALSTRYPSTGGLQLTVRCYDLLHRLRKHHSLRMHGAGTVDEIARRFVDPLGLGLKAAAPGPLRRDRAQVGESDFDFLVRIAREGGLYPILRDETVQLITLAGLGPPVSAELGIELLEATAEVNAHGAAHSVSAHGWGATYARSAASVVTNPRSGGPTERAVDVSVFGGDGQAVLADCLAEDAEQASSWAAAELERRATAAFSLRGTLRGTTQVRPGAWLDVSGLSAPLCGRYVVVSAEHSLDARSGYLTRFSTAPPPAPKAPFREPATLGIVTRVDDPEQLGRVRVRFPGSGNIESGWLPVACVGAGANKGFVHLPGLEDRVLVLLTAGDYATGVVLGGLFGDVRPPEAGVVAAQTQKFTWQSPAGLRIQLDDEAGTATVAADRIRLSIDAESFVELAADLLRVHATSDLVLSAPGKRILIEAARIDFKERAS